MLDRLQAEFDQWAEEFAHSARLGADETPSVDLERQTHYLVERCLDRIQQLVDPTFDPRLAYVPALPR